jgi:hypothetical protein
MQIITNKLIEQGKSDRGGWNKKQLAILGIKWPPKQGWKWEIIGNIISEAGIMEFLSLRNKNINRRKHGR